MSAAQGACSFQVVIDYADGECRLEDRSGRCVASGVPRELAHIFANSLRLLTAVRLAHEALQRPWTQRDDARSVRRHTEQEAIRQHLHELLIGLSP